MGDIAGAVGTFLFLATGWYKGATSRGTASATFDNHYKNFLQFHEHIRDPLQSLFELDERRRNPLYYYQAIRILHLLVDLRAWLTDAGFSSAKRSTIVAVIPRNSTSVPSQAHLVRRQRKGHGHLVHPTFGLTGKEVAFITLFERIRAAYERLEDSYPLEAYNFMPDPVYPAFVAPPVQVPYPSTFDPEEPNTVASGMRGGYNSDFDGGGGGFQSRPTDRFAQDHDIHRPGPQGQPRPDAGGTHEEGHDIPRVPPPDPRPDYGGHRRRPEGHYFYPPPPPMPMPTSVSTVQKGWFFLTKRQKLREDEMLQNLSKRLEHDIKEMMIFNGDTRKSRRRRDLQEPLQRARQEVLKEQLIREELFEEQKVRAETERAEEKARFLRTSRVSRPSDEKIIIDEWFGSEDEDYAILRSYSGPDGVRIDPEQGRPEWDRRSGFQGTQFFRRRPNLDEMKINQGRDRPEMERRQPLQEDRWELRARERQTAAGEERLRKQRQEFVLERKRFEEEKQRPRAEDKLQREHSGRERMSRRPDARHIIDPMPDPEGDGNNHVPHPSLGSDDAVEPNPDRLGRERHKREEEGRREILLREKQANLDQERLRTQQNELETDRQRAEEAKRQHEDDKIRGKRRESRRKSRREGRREGRSEEAVTKRPDDHFHRKPDRSAREEEKSGREREHLAQHEEDEKVRRDRLKHERDLRIYKEPSDWRKRSGGWSPF